MKLLKKLLLNRASLAALGLVAAVSLTASTAFANEGLFNGRGGDPDRGWDPIFTDPPVILLPWTPGPRIVLHTVQEGGEDDESGFRFAGPGKLLEDPTSTLGDLPRWDSPLDQPGASGLIGLPPAPAPWPTLVEPDGDHLGGPGDSLAPPAGTIPAPGAWPLLALGLAPWRRRRRR